MPLADLRRRAARLLVLAGGGVAALLLVPRVPHEHRVGLRLPDAATVTGVDVSWAPAASSGDAVGQGGSWHFASGSAPATIDTHVRLPDGRYELDVTIERAAGREAFRKLVTLGDAEHITVPLR